MGVITPEQLAAKYGLDKEPVKTIKTKGAADLSSSASTAVHGMSMREAESFSDRGINVSPRTLDRAIDYRAEKQTVGEDFANSLLRGTIGALGVALEDLSYMSLQPVGEMLGVLDKYEKNIFATWGEELKNSGRELFPNYKRHDAGIWNVWDITSDLIENGLGFAIPGAIAGRAAMGLGKLSAAGLRSLSKGERLKAVSNLANVIRESGKADAVLSNISGGLLMNYAEGTMMGMETYQDLMSRVGQLNERGEVITEDMAVQAANQVRNMNRALMVTDMFAIHGLYKGTKGLRNTMKDPKAWKQNLKAAFTEFNSDNPIAQSLTEGFEEIAQGVLQREATNNVTGELGTRDFIQRIEEYFKDESMWYEGALGFLSGGVQSQGMKAISGAIDNRKASKLEAQIDNLSAQVNSETDPKKKVELQLALDELENTYYRTTRAGQYANQQKQLIENDEYLNKNLGSLAKQQALMELAIRENNEQAAAYVANAGFVRLFYDNASRGTLDSLERSLQDLIETPLSKEERESRGLSDNYTRDAQEHLAKIKELEKDYTAASAYINPAAIFFQTQNLKIQNQFLGATREVMNEVADKLKKDLSSQKVSGVSVEDVLNDRVTKTDDPVKNAKIDDFVNAVKSTPEYETYVNHRESEAEALTEIKSTKEDIERLKSKKYEKEIKEKIKTNEQAEQDQKKKNLQAEAQSKKQSKKLEAVEKAKKSQQPNQEQENKKDLAPKMPNVGIPATPKSPEDGGGNGVTLEEDLPAVNTDDLFGKETTDEKETGKENKKPPREGDSVQEEDEDVSPNSEDVEIEEEETPSLEDLSIEEIEFESDNPISWGENESEKVEDKNALAENIAAEKEDLSEHITPEKNAELRNSSKEYNQKTDQQNKATSSVIKVQTGNTREWSGGKETSDRLNSKTPIEQLRNVLDPEVAPAGTELYFEIDLQAPFFNPPGNEMSYDARRKKGLKGLTYQEALEMQGSGAHDFGPYAYFGVPIKVFTKDGKFLGYLPPISTNNSSGIAEGGFESLAATSLGKLRNDIVANPNQRFTGKVKQRLDGHYFKTSKPVDQEPTASHALPDVKTIILKGLKERIFGTNNTIPENIDNLALSSFVHKGHTYAVLPDGGVVPLFKKKLADGHIRALTSAVTIFSKIQAGVELSDNEKRDLNSFKSAGYTISTPNGIQNLLSKYVYLFPVDKAFNITEEDKALTSMKPTSGLAKYMLQKALGDKFIMAIEQNGLSFVNGFSQDSKTVGYSLSKNTPKEFLSSDKLQKALTSFFSMQYYNTDAAAMAKDDKFVDVFFDNAAGSIQSAKITYTSHILSSSTTNVVGNNIGTEDKPKYSYRVNPSIIIEDSFGQEENKTKEEPVKPEVKSETTESTVVEEEIKSTPTEGKAKTLEELDPDIAAIMGSNFGDDAIMSNSLGDSKFGEFRMYLFQKDIIDRYGNIKNYAEFQNLAAQWTTRLSERISERLGVPVRLQQLAWADPNNKMVANKRSLDFYDLAMKGITSKNAYLVKEMNWLRDNEFVQKMTVERLAELKQHKITCR